MIRAIMAGTVALTVLAAPASASATTHHTHRLPACRTESGGPFPCFWDASRRGNRRGHDVINFDRRTYLVRHGNHWTKESSS